MGGGGKSEKRRNQKSEVRMMQEEGRSISSFIVLTSDFRSSRFRRWRRRSIIYCTAPSQFSSHDPGRTFMNPDPQDPVVLAVVPSEVEATLISEALHEANIEA